MKLFVNYGSDPARGELVYRPEEYSFDTLDGVAGMASLLVNDIQMEVDGRGRVCCVWGLCDHPSRWHTSKLTAPAARAGVLLCGEALTPGVSVQLNDSRWTISTDIGTGWITIGCDVATDADEAVEFQTKCVAILRAGELVRLWLRPRVL